MTFDIRKADYDREHIYVIEADLDYCSNTFGVAPCTATGSGDAKCFNTFESCQDIPNYTLTGITTGEQTISVDGTAKTFTRLAGSYLTDGFVVGHTFTSENMTNAANNQTELLISAVTALVITCSTATGLVTDTGDGDEIITLNAIKTYRFCEKRSPHPLNLDAIPSISSVTTAPAVIDITGGLGIRSNLSVSFVDHPHSDIDIDPYITERTWDAFERGTFWTKFRARNPNYQFRDIRSLSGYLVGGVYDATNFQTRHFIIDTLSASRGRASIVGKDPLKLASSKKAQVPAPSTAQLNAAINNSVTSLVLKPSGVGDLEFATTGADNYCLIGSEVCSYTRVAASDTLTITRGQYNTVAAAHSVNDTVQVCYYKNDKVDVIVADMMTNFANIDPSFTPTSAWDAETDTYLSGLLEGIIVKPMDVWKALKELSEAAPHYTWWDERIAQIQLTALKAPPPTANVLNMDENIIADSLDVKDNQDMRASTVFVNFGQFDPTKKLDEPGNFQQSYVRPDTDSIVKYQSNQIKSINSRWINVDNKAAAVSLAALYGRRFSNIPRDVTFSLDAKDSDVWAGQNRSLNHRDIPDLTGVPVDTMFQITSVKEGKNYDYAGIEFAYGDEITGDPVIGVDTVYISEQQNVDLKTLYETNFGSITGQDVEAIFIVEGGVTIGSSSLLTDSLDTGDWSAATTFTITLQIDSGGYVAGPGGDGEDKSGTPVAESGGDAINMQADLTIINNGVIGGGGGGGGSAQLLGAEAAGGGGAGNNVGVASLSSYSGGGTLDSLIDAEDGTVSSGGNGARIHFTQAGEPHIVTAGKGGNLGESGSNGGAAGVAIKKNGNTITFTVEGNIHGTVA